MRRKFLIPLTFAAGVLVLASLSGVKTYQKVAADPEPDPEPATTEANHYMPFNNTNFTETGDHGYARLGVIHPYDFTSWSGRFNALDSFFSGESSGIGENESGYFDSISWHQKKDNPYVYFTLAGNSKNYIEVLRKSNNSVLGSVNNDQFNGNPMVMNYIEIDTSALSENEEVFLRIHDDSYQDEHGGYRFVTFGYCHVNATDKDVSDAIWTHINSLTTEYDAGNNEVHYRIRETMNFYLNGKASTDGILLLSDNKNLSADEDFESNAGFLNNWYRDTTYDHIVWWDNGDIHRDNINDHYYKSWDKLISNGTQHNHERMPFNKTGERFFKGYHEPAYGTDEATGFMDTDASKYRFVTKPFVLSGEGFISVKMSGHTASLHVLRGNTELAFIDNKTNSRAGSNTNITTGYNCLTMVRHVINLSAFKGQVIQIAIADVNCDGDYGAVNFDELITKYDSVPTFKVDTVVQGDSIHNYYPDFYVPMTNSKYGLGIDYKNDEGVYDIHEDNSAVNEAYNYLKSYYSSLRSPSNRFDYSVASGATKVNVVVDYNSLSSAAKTIVGNSKDILYTESWNNDWYVNAVNTASTISSPLAALVNDINAKAKSVSALKFNYSEAAGVFSYTNSTIRFGAFIKKDLFDNLGTVEGYGVVVALTSSLEGASIKDKYLAKKAQFAADENPENDTVAAILDAICDGTNVKKASATGSSPVEADAQQKAFMGIDSSDIYYTWTVRKAVGGDEFNKSFTAVGYIVVDGNIVFLNEMTTSFKALAISRLPSYDSHPAHDAIQYITEHFE